MVKKDGESTEKMDTTESGNTKSDATVEKPAANAATTTPQAVTPVKSIAKKP